MVSHSPGVKANMLQKRERETLATYPAHFTSIFFYSSSSSFYRLGLWSLPFGINPLKPSGHCMYHLL
jgi:hypothetical protein